MSVKVSPAPKTLAGAPNPPAGGKPDEREVGRFCKKCDSSKCCCAAETLEKMAGLEPQGIAAELLKANIELTKACSQRWLEEEKVKTSGLNIFVQTIARCFYVVVISLALFGISWNLKGCSIGAGRSGRGGTAPAGGLCTTTNHVVMTSVNSIAR